MEDMNKRRSRLYLKRRQQSICSGNGWCFIITSPFVAWVAIEVGYRDYGILGVVMGIAIGLADFGLGAGSVYRSRRLKRELLEEDEADIK